MNRRELAKKGLLGLFGFLLGKLPRVVDTSCIPVTYYLWNGQWERMEKSR